jgi:two-component system sensor histidine kinase AtoS
MKEVIPAIIHQTSVLERLTHGLIAYSKVYVLEKTAEDINILVEEVLESIAIQFQIQKIQIQKEMDSSLPKIYCDSHLLHEAFENILINAVQAIGSQSNQKIIIRTERVAADPPVDEVAGDFVKISIANTGSFIGEENKKKIFTPFFTTKETGSGLGLAIVKKIIEQHGGKMDVESQKEHGVLLTKISTFLPIT